MAELDRDQDWEAVFMIPIETTEGNVSLQEMFAILKDAFEDYCCGWPISL